MKLITDRTTWLQGLADYATCRSIDNHCKYHTRYTMIMSSVWRGSVSSVYTEDSLKCSDIGIAGHLLNANHVRLRYYTFGSHDDKYFLANPKGANFEDSNLYKSFYDTLPDINTHTHFTCLDARALWIPPRAQYGHYLMDILLPSLMCYKLVYGVENITIELLVSRPWQYETCVSFCKLLGFKNIIVHKRLLPQQGNLEVRFNSGLFILPCFPHVLEVINDFLCKSSHDSLDLTLKKTVYLGREGFGERRIINHAVIDEILDTHDIYKVLPHTVPILELASILQTAKIIISEPGTTPLIAYLLAPKWSRFITLSSQRTYTRCPPRYAYSGWKYHMPWLSRSSILWGFPMICSENPFSDSCIYPVEYLMTMLKIYLND